MTGTDVTWEDVSANYGAAIRAYHQSKGRTGDEPSVVSTIRTNTELVPKRGENLVRMLEEMTPVGGLAGKRVLELGSGFGALATYLAWSARPAEMVAVDMRDDFVAAAREASRAAAVPGLRFEAGDMRDLGHVGRGFDVVIVNNAFIYLPTAADMDAAIREIAAVLAPGGWVLFYHANKWRLREPFSQAPVIHLLPPRVADLVSRRTGWKHNHGRVRLVSPPELSRRLRRAGFSDVAVTGFGKERRRTGPKRFLGNFYALAARHPG